MGWRNRSTTILRRVFRGGGILRANVTGGFELPVGVLLGGGRQRHDVILVFVLWACGQGRR